jgi:hypothetical protein
MPRRGYLFVVHKTKANFATVVATQFAKGSHYRGKTVKNIYFYK